MVKKFRIKLSIIILLFACMSPVSAIVSFGGYAPFGPSTQKETTGSRNTFSFDPMLGVNTILTTPFYGQLFLPEFAMVFHGSGDDDYKKNTWLFLADFGHRINNKLLLRYGLGTILTKISGDGGAVQLNNGGSTATFYQPNETSTSWNTTINLGLESAVTGNYAVRFETYLFSFFNNEARKFSYSLNVVYFL